MERAREQLAELIGARDPKEIVLTSGGTEADNLAIKGVVEMYREKGNHIVTAMTEQRAVLDPCRRLEKQGLAQVTYLPVDAMGVVDPDARPPGDHRQDRSSSPSCSPTTRSGPSRPIQELSKIAKEQGVLFHTDATEAVGKIPVDVEKMGIDLLSCTAHKIYGPEGHRGAVRAAAQPAGAPRAHDRRRRPRAGHALRHGAGRAGGRLRPGGRDLPRGHARGSGAALPAAGPAAGPDPLLGGRGVPERPPGAPAAAHAQHLASPTSRASRSSWG